MAHHGRGVVRLALVAMLAAVPAAALAQAPAAEEVTFTRDIVPILQRSCQVCHRQGEMAPMSLVTYQEVRPWARSIKNRVVNREMPPWHIDKNIGIQKFKNDTSLSDEEIALVAAWVDSGAPMGDPNDMPPPVEFADASEWQIGEPDLVVRFPAYPVPAEGPDLFGNIYTDLDLDEDRYIKAIQTRVPDDASRRVVHHALSFAVDPEEQQMREAGDEDIPAAMFLVEYASGKQSEIYPENSGLLLESWRRMRLDYHLHSVGEDVDAKVELGMVFHPKGHVPEHIRWSKQLGQHVTDLDIPPGKIVRTDGYTYFHNAARITAFQPHMHALRHLSVPGADLPDGGNAGPDRSGQLRPLGLQLAHGLQLRRRRGPHRPGRDRGAHHQLARQHRGVPGQPGSEELDGQWRAHDRRDGVRVARLVRPDRRGVRRGIGRAEGAAGSRRRHRSAAVAASATVVARHVNAA